MISASPDKTKPEMASHWPFCSCRPANWISPMMHNGIATRAGNKPIPHKTNETTPSPKPQAQKGLVVLTR